MTLSSRTVLPLISAVVLLAAPGAVLAEDKDEINTDRPDFVDSSDVVGKGRFQVETGLAYARNAADGARTRTTSTPILLRFGVGDRLELRLGTDGRIAERAENLATGGTQTTRGYGDLSVSAKWHLLDGEASRPSVGVIVQTDLDTGSAAFRGNGARPSVRVSEEWSRADGFSLGMMEGVLLDKNDAGGRFVSGLFGIVLGKDWNERFHSFVEIATPKIASAKNGGSTASFDFGGSYQLSKAWQVDGALFTGLNKRTPDYTWVAGLSAKF